MNVDAIRGAIGFYGAAESKMHGRAAERQLDALLAELEAHREVEKAARGMRQPMCSCSRWDMADGPQPEWWTKRVCETCKEFTALRDALDKLDKTRNT